jgi:hypothetical protein
MGDGSRNDVLRLRLRGRQRGGTYLPARQRSSRVGSRVESVLRLGKVEAGLLAESYGVACFRWPGKFTVPREGKDGIALGGPFIEVSNLDK